MTVLAPAGSTVRTGFASECVSRLRHRRSRRPCEPAPLDRIRPEYSSEVAALAFVGMFTILNALSNDSPWLGALMGFTYFGTGAIVVLRWGLLSFAVAHFVTALLLSLPATLDTSAWYFGNMLLLVA